MIKPFAESNQLTLANAATGSAGAMRKKRLGLSTNTYGVRWRNGTRDLPAFKNSLDLIDHCQKLGAGGVQIVVSRWTAEYARQVRDKIEQHDLYLEGQIGLPANDTDAERFDHEVAIAKDAGVKIIRTVMLGSRRYETFETLEAWRDHVAQAWHSLMMAAPIMAKHQVKLAIENHKDWRAADLVEAIQRVNSDWVGINLDLGNNVSVLDDPNAAIEEMAPYALTTHFKDMAVQEYEDGFLLSEVPLGKGVVDLKRAIAILEKYNPAIQYNLEMITRDPLKIPVYTDKYWVTFGDLRASQLASALELVRKKSSARPLPLMSKKSIPEKIEFEEQNNVESFEYARKELGL